MSSLTSNESVHKKHPRGSRFRVTLSITVSLGGFAVFVLLWFATILVATLDSKGMSAITIGYAYEDAWLVNAVIHSDGIVVIRQFDHNLTYHTGLYAKLSDSRSKYPFTAQLLWPRTHPRRFAREWSIHLALPIMLFVIASLLTVVRPRFQKRRRERLGLCSECGYDLLKNESGVCPECGTSIEIKKPFQNNSSPE